MVRERKRLNERKRLTPPPALSQPRRRSRHKLVRGLPETWVKSMRKLAKKDGLLPPKLLDRRRWDEKRWDRHNGAWDKFTEKLREEQRQAQERWREKLHEYQKAKTQRFQRKVEREAHQAEVIQRKVKKSVLDERVLSALGKNTNTVRKLAVKLDRELREVRQALKRLLKAGKVVKLTPRTWCRTAEAPKPKRKRLSDKQPKRRERKRLSV